MPYQSIKAIIEKEREQGKGKPLSKKEPGLEWTAKQVMTFLKAEFPQAFEGGKQYEVVELSPDHLVLVLKAGQGQLRPGGTVSGPAQMELADLAVYFLLLAHHGEQARLCVTTNLTCSFLRKPRAGELVCDVRLIKHGRTLAVADVRINSHEGLMLSHLELTYFTGNLNSS